MFVLICFSMTRGKDMKVANLIPPTASFEGLAQLGTFILGGNQIRSIPTDARAWHNCRHSV